MWIKCRCGNIINDNTDNIPFKGHILSDKEFFKFLDFTDRMIESKSENREKTAMTFRNNLSGYIKIKSVFQCSCCGRILLEDENNHYCSFLPEEHEKYNLLDFNGNDTIAKF